SAGCGAPTQKMRLHLHPPYPTGPECVGDSRLGTLDLPGRTVAMIARPAIHGTKAILRNASTVGKNGGPHKSFSAIGAQKKCIGQSLTDHALHVRHL
ncbi:hypothetical protein, partial [Caballeronia calidae]|uniref:hypothetical protein n=1 Tax=Caballeronia calidae TaxID=1777139 RepID=UPI001E531BBF